MARNAQPTDVEPVSQRVTIPTPMPGARVLVDAGVYRFVRHDDEDELTPPSTRRL